MKRLFIGLFLAVLTLPAAAQGVPRVKGRITAFDGLTFQLAPEGGGQPLSIRLQSRTQFMTLEPRTLAIVKPGVYAGATVVAQEGALVAREVHLYPEPLRGSGEGRLPQANGSTVINGAVTAAGNGRITLFYRGGRMAGGVCLDRPDPRSPSPVCTADPLIQVPRDATVWALVPGGRQFLTVGTVATVSVETDAKGVRSTPGLILEKPQTSK
jgi:hypothetical protein